MPLEQRAYCQIGSTQSIVNQPDQAKLQKLNFLQQPVRGYSVALYGCIITLRERYISDSLSIVIDRIEKPYDAIAKSITYADTDTWSDLKTENLSIQPLEEGQTCKNVMPMQAGDWMSWEQRKAATARISWDVKLEDTVTQGLLYHAHLAWRKDVISKTGKEPYDNRKSAWALYKAAEAKGFQWDYETLKAADINRHKNGWAS